MKRWSAIALSASVLILAGCSTYASNEVSSYCEYGAVSQAQLDGCKDHVTASQVETRDTNAAQFAKGQIDDCLADAGPFCRPRVARPGEDDDPWAAPGQ